MVDRLLRQAEVPVPTKSHLEDHEIGRRTRVDGDDVQLGPPDADLATENRPAGCGEPGGHQQFRRVAAALLRGAHRPIFGPGAACRLITECRPIAGVSGSGGSERLQPDEGEIVREIRGLGEDRGALLEQVER